MSEYRRLEVERWLAGDTEERSPMYCLYLKSDKPVLEWGNRDWLRVGDVWDGEGADYLNRLEALAELARRAVREIAACEGEGGIALWADLHGYDWLRDVEAITKDD